MDACSERDIDMHAADEAAGSGTKAPAAASLLIGIAQNAANAGGEPRKECRQRSSFEGTAPPGCSSLRSSFEGTVPPGCSSLRSSFEGTAPPGVSSLCSIFEGTVPPNGSSLRSSFEGTMPPHGSSLHSKASGSCCGEGPAGGPCSCALVGGAELPSPSCRNGLRHSFDSASSRCAKQMPRQGSAPDGLPPLAPPPQVINSRGGPLPRQSLPGNLEGAPPVRGPPGPQQPSPSPPLLAQAGVEGEGGPATTTEGSTPARGAPTGRAPLVYRPTPRPSRVLLLMELGDQRSLHSAISKGRLSGNMVRSKFFMTNLFEQERRSGHLDDQQYINTAT